MFDATSVEILEIYQERLTDAKSRHDEDDIAYYLYQIQMMLFLVFLTPYCQELLN